MGVPRGGCLASYASTSAASEADLRKRILKYTHARATPDAPVHALNGTLLVLRHLGGAALRVGLHPAACNGAEGHRQSISRVWSFPQAQRTRAWRLAPQQAAPGAMPDGEMGVRRTWQSATATAAAAGMTTAWACSHMPSWQPLLNAGAPSWDTACDARISSAALASPAPGCRSRVAERKRCGSSSVPLAPPPPLPAALPLAPPPAAAPCSAADAAAAARMMAASCRASASSDCCVGMGVAPGGVCFTRNCGLKGKEGKGP